MASSPFPFSPPDLGHLESSIPPLMFKRWTRGEDAVLLSHVRQKGTKQWSLLHSSGLLPDRDNKACCNRWRILKAKLDKKKDSDAEESPVIGTEQSNPGVGTPPSPLTTPSPEKQEPDTWQHNRSSSTSPLHTPLTSSSCITAAAMSGYTTLHSRLSSPGNAPEDSKGSAFSPQSATSAHPGVPFGCQEYAQSAPLFVPDFQEDTAVPGEWMMPCVDLPGPLEGPLEASSAFPLGANQSWAGNAMFSFDGASMPAGNTMTASTVAQQSGCLVGEALTCPQTSELLGEGGVFADLGIFMGSSSKTPFNQDPAPVNGCLIGPAFEEALLTEFAGAMAPPLTFHPPSRPHHMASSRPALHFGALGNASVAWGDEAAQAALFQNESVRRMQMMQLQLHLQKTASGMPGLVPALPQTATWPEQSMRMTPSMASGGPADPSSWALSAQRERWCQLAATAQQASGPAQQGFSRRSLGRSWTTGNLEATAGRQELPSEFQTYRPASQGSLAHCGSLVETRREAQLPASMRSGSIRGHQRLTLKSLGSETTSVQGDDAEPHPSKRPRRPQDARLASQLSIGTSSSGDSRLTSVASDHQIGAVCMGTNDVWTQMRQRWVAQQIDQSSAADKDATFHWGAQDMGAAQQMSGPICRQQQTLAAQLEDLQRREMGSLAAGKRKFGFLCQSGSTSMANYV